MSPVETPGIDPVQLVDPPEKVYPAGFYDQIIMILHETVSMENPIEPGDD
jgi:hypothetical protein